jgi:hypothetical protein
MLTRRTLVQGVSAVALATFGLNFAEARETGSDVQVGVPNPDPSAFKNFMSSFGSLQASIASYAYPAVLSVDQYPVGTIGSTLFGTIPLPSDLKPSDTLVFAWTGDAAKATGAMQLARGAPGFVVTAGDKFVIGSTSFNVNMSGRDGYIEFRIEGSPPATITFSFLNGSTFISLSKIIFCRKADYASIATATEAGQLISSAYLNAFKKLLPKTIRTMAYVNPNEGNNFTQHKYRPDWKSVLSYGNGQWLPNCWAGISSGTNSYIVVSAADTPRNYTMGEVLQLQFVSASTAKPLLIDVGNRGFVPLLDMNGNALAADAIKDNSLATLIYDDLLGGYLSSFGGLTGNIPVEVQVALANQVGTNLWYTFPPHITFSSVSEITKLIGRTLEADCYFEFANEVWAFGYGFPQTTWALQCGVTLGFPKDNNRHIYGFYALRIAQIMPLVKSAWGARSGLKCVLAFQAYGPTGGTNQYRLQGADLSTSLGYKKYDSYVRTSFNVSPNRPVDVCEVLSYATYYSGAQCANFDPNYVNVGGAGLTTGGPPGWNSGLLGAADAYATGDAKNMASAIAFLDWDIRQGTNNGKPGSATLFALKKGMNGGVGIYPAWEEVARNYDDHRPAGKLGLMVECYEGAMECSAPSKSRCTALAINASYGGLGGKIDNLIIGYKNSNLFYATVQQQYKDFLTNAHSKTASWFLMTGANQWSMYPGDVYSTPFKSFTATSAQNL